jgi:hypothetical protein
MQSYRGDDRVYHGIQQYENPAEANEWQPARILVEVAKDGPTERTSAALLRELPELLDGGFGWSYNGSGTSRAAAVILADALGIDTHEFWVTETGIPNEKGHFPRLREDFCREVLSQFCDEWRLRHAAVVTWVRGWYARHNLHPLFPTLIA